MRTSIPGSIFSSGPAFNSSDTSAPSPFSEAATAETYSPEESHSYSEYVPSRLSPDHKLGFLLKYCFDELETYYPCVDRVDFYNRLSTLFTQHCSYKDNLTLVPKTAEHLALAALTCAILALATHLGGHSDQIQPPGSDDDYAAAGYEWHLESRKLLAEYAWDNEPCLDVLRLHILEVLYYTMVQKRRAMSMAKAVAVELAFALELNNEAAWNGMKTREREYRRLLWWMTYIIDRRISIRTGRPYLIHDSEFSVGMFSSQSRMCFLADDAFELEHGRADMAFKTRSWPRPSMATEDWFAYLQFNIRWSKIATRVWDNCCSLRVSNAVDLDEIDTLDMLLLNLERSLPPTLLWDPNGMYNLVQAGKTDRYLRLRLIMFEVCSW